jgi:hemerythrin-like domain-containing protein
MNRSIEMMMGEHRLIEQVLGALQTCVDTLSAGTPVPRATVAGFADFFQNFADKCHHGKEEDRLFVKMNQFGFPREYGPIGVMLAEHAEGRRHVRALAEVGQGTGPLSAPEQQAVVAHATAFIPLLGSHIQKEDNILYPMAQQAIPPADFEKLDAACADFEHEVLGAAQVQRLKDLALELIGRFPPNLAAIAAAGCAGCRGH